MASVPTYSVQSSEPDGYLVHRVVRTKGGNTREITEYTKLDAAEKVAEALNSVAEHED
jgi:hypothetical protein